MNMTPQAKRTLWEIINDQLEGVDCEDAEWVCEQWVAEISMGMGGLFYG